MFYIIVRLRNILNYSCLFANNAFVKYLFALSLFLSQEHCLMGIKGTVRRNQDGHFIHANIDLDIIITEETPIGNDSLRMTLFGLFALSSVLMYGWM